MQGFRHCVTDKISPPRYRPRAPTRGRCFSGRSRRAHTAIMGPNRRAQGRERTAAAISTDRQPCRFRPARIACRRQSAVCAIGGLFGILRKTPRVDDRGLICAGPLPCCCVVYPSRHALQFRDPAALGSAPFHLNRTHPARRRASPPAAPVAERLARFRSRSAITT